MGNEVARKSSEVARNKQLSSVTFEDVRIVFRNFQGAAGKYNREGERSFSVILDHESADAMLADGWNVKYLKAREEGELPQPYLSIAVNFEGPRPPRLVLVTSRNKTELGPEDAALLDWADIKTSDLIISPYSWDVNGKQGIKAYLRAIYCTINEDELQLKYADVPDSAADLAITNAQVGQLALEDGETIWAEVVEDDESTPF